MAIINLQNESQNVITGNDNIVIIDNLQSVRGGRSLDMTGYPFDFLHAGHVIIKDAEGEYKPMPLDGVKNEGYGALPDGASYEGILIASIPADRPFAGILVRGTVNVNACPFAMTTILSAVKTALPLVVFTSDNA